MDSGLLTLFFGSFLASTLLPGGVEGLLYYMVSSQGYGFWSLFWVATFGNTMGGWVTWWVGLLLYKGLSNSRLQNRLSSWFQMGDKALQRVRRFGPVALLFSWMPIVGDPLCVAAGYLTLPFWRCALFIFIGKAVRYLVLLWAFF